MVITLDEAIDYIGLDKDVITGDKVIERNINQCIQTAEMWIKGAVGKSFDKDDSRVKQLALILTDDFYSNREFTDKSQGNMKTSKGAKRIVDDLVLQLRLEMTVKE